MSPSDTIDLITAIWLGVLGACVGSFLNVVAYRVPLGLSVVWQSSHCPHCKQAIRPYDNVPVLGWLWLRGKCRDCGAAISPRYAIVEAIMGIAFFVLAYLELFKGGALLPDGALTNRTGAMDVVWNPHWPTLAVYAFHCGLASAGMILILLRLDKNISVRKFSILLIVTLSLWWLPYVLRA